jgi:hypothetical protein
MTAVRNTVAETTGPPRENGTNVRKKPEEIYDNSFVLDLEKSGFMKEIWGARITSGSCFRVLCVFCIVTSRFWNEKQSRDNPRSRRKFQDQTNRSLT